MDQQHQEQQKKKRPYYNNRRRGNGNATPEAAENHTQTNTAAPSAGANKHAQKAHRSENHNEARNSGKGRGGEIHTRRGGFHPTPDAPAEDRRQASSESAREGKDNRQNQENRENPRNGNKNRGGRGHAHDGHSNDNRPKNTAVKENKSNDTRSEDVARDTRGKDTRNTESKNNDNRNRARNDRNRGRRVNAEENASNREPAPTHKDPEMDSWFTSTAAEPLSDMSSFSDKPPVAIEPDALPHIELDLNDILPPIALQKYENEQQETQEKTDTEPDATNTEAEAVPSVEVVGVRFNKTGKVYYFAPNGTVARRGDAVIVETARGLEFGEAWQPTIWFPNLRSFLLCAP